MMKWLRIGLIAVGTAAGLLMLLLVGGVSYVKTPQAHRVIQQHIDRILPGSVSWRRLDLSVLAGRIEIDDLLVAGPGGERLAGMTRGRVDISWLSLLKGRIGVEEAVFGHPWAELAVDETGRLNLARAFSESPEAEKPAAEPPAGLSLNLEMTHFRLADGALSYRDPAAGLAVTVEGISAGADAFRIPSPSGSIRLGIGRGDVQSPVFTGPIEALQASAHLDADRLSPLELRLLVGDTDLRLAGTVDRPGTDPILDLTLDAALALAEIRHLLGLAPELTGSARLHLAAKGRLADPEARMTLAYDGGLLAGFPVERIDLGLHLAERKLRIDPLVVESRFGMTAATGELDLRKTFPEGFLSPDRALDVAAYRLAVRQTGLALEKALAPESGYGGRLEADLTLEGKGTDLREMLARYHLGLIGKGISAPGMGRPVNVAAAVRGGIEDGEALFEAFTVEAGGVRMSGRGRYAVTDGGLGGELTLATPELSEALALVGITGVRGGVSATASVDGTLDRPKAALEAIGKGISLPNFTLGDLRLSASLDAGGTLSVSSLTLENQGSRAVVRGRVDLLKRDPEKGMRIRPDLPLDLTLNLENVEPSDFIQDRGLSGRIDGSVTARGPARSPDVRAEISGKGVAAAGVRIGDVAAGIQLTAGRVRLSPVAVANGRSRASVSGSIDLLTPGTGALRKDPAMDLRLAGEPLFLEDFIEGMTGAVTLSGEIGGSVSRPRGRADLTATTLDLGGQPIDGVELAAHMDGRSIRVDRLQVAVTPKETLVGSGSIDLERSAYDLRLSSAGISLAMIRALADVGVTGTAALDLSGRGTFGDPRAEGRVTVTGIQVNQRPAPDLRVDLDVRDQTARVRGRWGVDLDGSYHLAKKTFSAALGFDRTDLAPYLRIAGLADMGGRIDGSVTARGRSDAPEQIRVDANLRDLTFTTGGRELLSSPRLVARMENRTVTLPNMELRLLKEGRLTLGGRGRIAGRIDFTASGRIPFSIIQPFLEYESDAGGAILVDAGVGGTLAAPEIRGVLTLDRLGANLPGLSQRLQEVTGRIVASPEALVLEKIEGRIDGGGFSLAGRVDLDRFRPVRMDLRTTARRLPIEVPDTLSLVLDSALSLTGTAEQSLLKGEIVLLEGRYFKDVELRPIRGITRRTREVTPEPAGGSVPFLANMKLGIVIQRREPFAVENNLADMRLSPDLRILGTAARPVISGRAGVDEGVITYQAISFRGAELGFRTTEFEIRKGVVDFLNPYKTEPTIDIVGEASVRDWAITLKISGTPDNLDFKLSSDPFEEDADILSLLLVGKTLKEMREEDASGLSARQMLGDILADSVASGVRDATGLDIVELEYDEAEGPEDRDDVKVTLGKELSRRITVKYGAELKDGETVQKVISEYKILEALLVSAFQDTAGNFGGALTYRVEFW